mgnify:CR=1 FL=1
MTGTETPGALTEPEPAPIRPPHGPDAARYSGKNDPHTPGSPWQAARHSATYRDGPVSSDRDPGRIRAISGPVPPPTGEGDAKRRTPGVSYRAIASQYGVSPRSEAWRTIPKHRTDEERRGRPATYRNIPGTPPPGIRGILPVVPPPAGGYAADAYRPGSDEGEQCTGYKAVSRGARESVTRARISGT